MLLYYNRGFFRLILACKGTVIHRWHILVGLLIAGVAEALAILHDKDSQFAAKLPHHYGILVIGGAATFAVVYRTNLGWSRYWEAMTQQHFMYSKWTDTYAQFYAFAQTGMEAARKKGGSDNEAKIGRIAQCLHRVEQNFSVLSALAAHRLTHGDNERMRQRFKVNAHWRERLMLRRDLRTSDDLTGATQMPNFQVGKPMNLADSWSQEYSIVRLLSNEEHNMLMLSKDRVNAVMYWILHDFAEVSGDFSIAPPIQSRMYQELSNGMLGFNNCQKIADVPFPFPYAHLLTWILVVFSCMIPFYVPALTKSLIMSPIAAFGAFIILWSVNEVAIELENPFGSDVNDISCRDFHVRFLDNILEHQGYHEAKVLAQLQAKTTEDAARVAFNPEAPAGIKPETASENVARADGMALGAKPLTALPATPMVDVIAKNCHAGAAESPLQSGIVEKYTRHLAELSSRIEVRLTQILRELERGHDVAISAISSKPRTQAPSTVPVPDALKALEAATERLKEVVGLSASNSGRPLHGPLREPAASTDCMLML